MDAAILTKSVPHQRQCRQARLRRAHAIRKALGLEKENCEPGDSMQALVPRKTLPSALRGDKREVPRTGSSTRKSCRNLTANGLPLWGPWAPWTGHPLTESRATDTKCPVGVPRYQHVDAHQM